METDLFSRSKVEESEWSEDRTKETSESQSEKRVLQPDDVQDESNRIKRSKVEAAKVEGHSESTNLIENEYVQDLRSNNADESVASKAIPPAELETVTHTSGQASDSEKNEPGLSALYQDFDEDYNEESDGDWNEGDSDNGDDVSDDDDSHDGFFLGVNDKYNELHGNSDDDGEDDQAIWPRYSEEETEKLQNQARQLGMIKFIEKYVIEGRIPLPQILDVFGCQLPSRISLLADDIQLLNLLRVVMTRFLRKRRRLENVNTIEDVVEIMKNAKNIMVLTGAGVSVSCGIPDFRSETGIYARLDEFDLDDPQQMFDIHYFRENPHIFYSFAREIYPSNFEPSPSHQFVKLLEDRDILLRNYTQNIDTLEHKAKITRVINCHGSFATATCVTCGYKCAGSDIEADIFAQRVPECPQCSAQTKAEEKLANDDSDDESGLPVIRQSIIKPDITFFGEKLPDDFDKGLAVDSEKVDLLIVMGSSLKVSPVSEIMTQIPHSVPQILINRTPITHLTFDVQLLGRSDVIVPELCRRLGWDLRHEKIPGGSSLSKENIELATDNSGSSKLYNYIGDGYYTFEGAVLGERLAESTR
ncbi:DHS-like NAD/FAD-binding domain-containing protein [Umbelopsis sp. PMI_123]|nr:DHS-like NAD/FAD-binding domain-containing protein [Umbelopsis sp. PMI_123]